MELDVSMRVPCRATLRGGSRQSVIELSERILRANSATRELEQWCGQHGLGDGRVFALCERDTRPQGLDDVSLDALAYPAARQHALFRRVRLATAGLVVAKALNWYFPENLTPEMHQQLQTTDTPFGRVVAAFSPRRQTFFMTRVVHEQFLATLFE